MSTTVTVPNNWKRNFYILGHIAKGITYTLVGGIALAGVIGEASGPGGMRDVIRWIQNQPFGQVLLALIALGLFSYCAWRWIKALEDTGNEGTGVKGIGKRTAYAASGTVYGMLGVYAVTLLSGNGSGGNSKQDMLGQILQASWGQVVVVLIAVALVGAGIYQLKKAIKEKYMSDIKHTGMGNNERRAYRQLGKAGYMSRSVVYGVMAFFLFRVALNSDPSQYRGVEGVLEYLGGQARGTILVALVALGLLLYGLFMFVKARYPRVA